MNRIDDRIRQALSAEDAELFEEFAVEPSLFELALETLMGRNRWMSVLVILVGAVFMGLSLICLWNVFQTDVTYLVVRWSLGFMFCMSAIAMMKLWYWMEMQRIGVTREIKRLELQVARLAQQVGDGGDDH